MGSELQWQEFLKELYSHFITTRPMLTFYAHLIASALFPIYTGAHASLTRPSTAAKPKKAAKAADIDGESENDEDEQLMQGLSNTDALTLPFIAAAVLGTMYFLISKYGAEFLNFWMGWYFTSVGFFSLIRFISDTATTLVQFVFPTYYAYRGKLWRVDAAQTVAVQVDSESETSSSPLPSSMGRIPLPRFLASMLWTTRKILKQAFVLKAHVASVVDVHAKPTLMDLIAFAGSLGILTYVNMVEKTWYMTNLQGFAVSYGAMQLLSPTSFATGSLVLVALFFYDIWAVFFTPLMITVAKNLDQPVKLVFPREDIPAALPDELPIKNYSMLGLGDIVVPGIMIGLAMRFDLHMYYLRKQTIVKQQTKEGSSDAGEVIEKASYISPRGQFGNRFWTYGLDRAVLPLNQTGNFPKPYFTASMIGYVLSMIATLMVMVFFDHAQPALLYLVPGVLISLWGTALFRGELSEMWNFSEAINGEQLEDLGKKEEKENENENGKEQSTADTGIQEPKEPVHDNTSHDEDISQIPSTVVSEQDKSSEEETKDAPTEIPEGTAKPDREGVAGMTKDDTLISFSFALYKPLGLPTSSESDGILGLTDSKDTSAGKLDSGLHSKTN